MSAINITNLTFRYPDSYENAFENFSVTLDTDWKLAVTGRNGRGKTTFLRLLSGALTADGGAISHAAPFEYFPFSVPDAPDALSSLYRARPELELWRLKRECTAWLSRKIPSKSPFPPFPAENRQNSCSRRFFRMTARTFS